MEETIVFSFDGDEDPEVLEAYQNAIREWVRRVYDATQERVPRESGFLASSGSYTVSFDDDIGTIEYSADYAEYVERGVEGRFEGRRYIEDSIDEWEPLFGDIFLDYLNDTFEVREGS